MTNSVFLIGKLKEKVSDNIRKIEIVKEIKDNNSNYIDTFLLTHWTRDRCAKIMQIPCGKTVIISGRIENIDGYGIVIIAEEHRLIEN